MSSIKSRHLLWVASLCSLGGIPLGLGAALSERRADAEIGRLKKELSQADLKIKDLKGEVQMLRETSQRATKACERASNDLDAKVAQIRTQQDALQSAHDALARRGDEIKGLNEVLKHINEKLATLVKRSWEDDLQPLRQEIRQIKERLNPKPPEPTEKAKKKPDPGVTTAPPPCGG